MNINIVTLFPEIFNSLNYGLLGQAIKRNDINVNIFNLRDHQINKHGQVDDKPYGGGEGMVLMAEPLEDCLKSISTDSLGRVLNLSPQGSLLNQKKAKIKVYRANAFSTFLRFPIITFINNWSTWYCCSVSSLFSSLSKIL